MHDSELSHATLLDTAEAVLDGALRARAAALLARQALERDGCRETDLPRRPAVDTGLLADGLRRERRAGEGSR